MKRLVSTLNLSKEDWLRYRKCGITGTDAGAILDVNPYRSAYRVPFLWVIVEWTDIPSIKIFIMRLEKLIRL